MTNKESTRYFSDIHEKSVVKSLGGRQMPNSGAGHFNKGDVIVPDADMLVECKTVTKAKESVSIKKEWIDKNREEAFACRFHNSSICFNFEPNGKNYYVIDEKLMKYLVEKISEDLD